MNIDRIVLTTFAGYFYSQILCLRSIEKYCAGIPIDIIIDDFDIAHWPDYPDQCQSFIKYNFANLDITFHRFSNHHKMHQVRVGGWFRQQLVKLYLDKFVTGQHWLAVDADVVFREPPRLDSVSAVVHHDATPIDIGNRLYVAHMLDCDKPWVIDQDQYWCLSGVPFRYLDHSLLQDLRQHIERVHEQDVFDLHLELFDKDQLVAYDPAAKTMIMSEFQLIEIFRHRYSLSALPIGPHTASEFDHSSIKDWKRSRSHYEQADIVVLDRHWAALQNFGQHHV